jgi:outer membrane receptor protein involved in Fe transport
VFAQASWQPSDRFEILASARFEYYKNTDGSDVIVNGAQNYYPTTTSTQLDPRVSFRYALAKSAAVRGAAYRAFKAPTLRDLYRNNQTGTSILLGNPDLEPETLVGAEVGVEWANDRAHVEVNLYRSDIDGLQSRAQVAGQPPNVFRQLNLGKSRSQGVEAMADVRFSPRWGLNLGYTYADSTIVEDLNPALVGKLVPEVAPHIGSIGLRYRGNDATTVDARYRMLSHSYGESANLLASPAHRVLDLSASRPIRSWIDAYAVLENALDESYYYVLTPTSLRSGQPRTFSIGIRMNVPTSRNRG